MKQVVAVLVALSTLAAAEGRAQSIQPVTEADAYIPVPNAAVTADAARTYKVVFDARQGAGAPDKLVPAVNLAGAELNTFATHGMARDKVRFAVVFHAPGADEAVLDNAHYRAKYGIDNPNLPALAALKREGVKLYVCGQQLQADGVPLDAVTPDVAIAEDGLVVLMSYGGDGYTQLTF